MVVNFGTKYVSPVWKSTKSFTRDYANFVLGVEQSDVFSRELQKTVRGIKDPVTKKYTGGKGFNEFGNSLKQSWTKSKSVVANKSLWQVIKKSVTNIPHEFKAAARLAKTTGKSTKFLGSSLKILGKRMPLLGNVAMVAFAVPNLYRAFTQGGIGTGVKEVGKEATKIGGFAVGAAIGQAVIPIPFVGAIVGGIIGGWIAEKVVGKSFTEKQEEEAAKATVGQPNQESQEIPNQQQENVDPAQAETASQVQAQAQTNPNTQANAQSFRIPSAEELMSNPTQAQSFQGATGKNPFGMNQDMFNTDYNNQNFMRR